MGKSDEESSILPSSDRTEKALDVASFVGSAVPWIGGPVSNVLGGMSLGRKLDRVRDVLEGLASDLRDFQSNVSENYVKTEEFEDLVEQTLRRVAQERSQEKRRAYRAFLRAAVKLPGESYDEQLRLLRILEELQPDHIQVIYALMQMPNLDSGWAGSPLQTLQQRLPALTRERIEELVAGLNDLRVTNLGSLKTLMTGRGAETLRHAITPLGQRLLEFILTE